MLFVVLARSKKQNLGGIQSLYFSFLLSFSELKLRIAINIPAVDSDGGA